MLHLVEDVQTAVSLYERLEPYEAFGEEIREAYLGLKHMREGQHEHVKDSKSGTKRKEHSAEEEGEVSDTEKQLGEHVLSALERSVGHEDFAAKLDAARRAHQARSECETAELDELLGDYVMVSKQDAVDAMADFIAAFISSLPEAQAMDSRKLQQALLSTIHELKGSRLKLVWQWGRYLYRGAAFAYSAFALYENPWLIRAVLTALWTSAHLLYGLLL